MAGINDFVIKVANVNGSGSASANGLLSRAIFRMGVPVSSKNIFPSNIQGLPTWYVIRVNKNAYLGRSEGLDFMIAMNPQTLAEDISNISPGGYLFYDSTLPLRHKIPDHVTPLAVPLTGISIAAFPETKTRLMMKNITYVGAAAAFLDIDLNVIKELLGEIYARKPHLIDYNLNAIRISYNYVKEHFKTTFPLRVEALERNSSHVLMTGNTATALGCLYGGATFAAWYPLTPSSSIAEDFTKLCEKYRRDPETKKNRYCIVQAEDELAAVGMVIGAGWSGGRAFTPTSGPGLSLMSEFLGLAYYAEIPVVIFDVQRTGPSTGLPTRTQQCDFLSAAYASHGDTKHILLFPAHPGECFSFSVLAFDLAERFQTPVIVLSDLDMGMNEWQIEKLVWDDNYRPDRGKILTKEELEAKENPFFRYIDADGDGICARTLPGVHPKGAYFTRGTGHNPQGQYSEKGSDYLQNVERLSRKWEGAKTAVPKALFTPSLLHKGKKEKASFGILVAGGPDAAMNEALALLRDRGIGIDYLCVKGFPFGNEVEEFMASYQQIFVVEQNRDAQLKSLLILETKVKKESLDSILFFSGFPITARFIADHVEEKITLWKQSAQKGVNK